MGGSISKKTEDEPSTMRGDGGGVGMSEDYMGEGPTSSGGVSSSSGGPGVGAQSTSTAAPGGGRLGIGGGGGGGVSGTSPQQQPLQATHVIGGTGAIPPVGSVGTGVGSGGVSATGESLPRLIPTVFRWEHGGNNVYITGTFNDWGKKIPLHRSGNDFTTIQNLPPTRHAYKFVVDDEWRFAPDLTTATDVEGNINNVLDLTNFNLDEEGDEDYVPWSTGTAAAATLKRRDSFKDPTPYSHTMPEEDAYTKEPPNLPPHLRSIVLNSPHPDTPNPMMLPTPMHVTLNHLCECLLFYYLPPSPALRTLFPPLSHTSHTHPHTHSPLHAPSLSPFVTDCTAIRDGLMMQATTGRYRRKFFSTVFLSPDTEMAAAK